VYHYKDSVAYSLETAPSEDYRKMYKKLMENKEEWLFDFTRVLEIQSKFPEGNVAYFTPDYQYYYLATNMIEQGMTPTIRKSKVNNRKSNIFLFLTFIYF